MPAGGGGWGGAAVAVGGGVVGGGDLGVGGGVGVGGFDAFAAATEKISAGGGLFPVQDPKNKNVGVSGGEARQSRTLFSVARLSGSSPAPWFCVPASRRVCLYRMGVFPQLSSWNYPTQVR